MNLYELTIDYRKLDQIEDANELKIAFDKLEDDFKTKAISLAKYYKEHLARIEAIDNELKRLADKKQVEKNRADSIKEYLFVNMEAVGIEKIDDPIIKLAIRFNPPSCEVKDVMALPLEYRKLIPENYVADRVAILKHFKESGEIVNGAELQLNNKRLEIK